MVHKSLARPADGNFPKSRRRTFIIMLRISIIPAEGPVFKPATLLLQKLKVCAGQEKRLGSGPPRQFKPIQRTHKTSASKCMQHAVNL